jgi:transposase
LNALADFNKLADQLEAASPCCEVALEPTGDYHRPLANFLVRRGHKVQFVSSIATHRTRETLFNSWDKNDPKDAQVIRHLLKGGVTQRYADPLQSAIKICKSFSVRIAKLLGEDASLSLFNDALSPVVLSGGRAISWELAFRVVSGRLYFRSVPR